MRTLMAIASTLTLAAAVSAQPRRAAETPEIAADPLYHIEVILFEQVEGNRAEEDFFHGIENQRQEPLLRLLELPRLELESAFDRAAAGVPDDSARVPTDATPRPGEIPPLEAADALLTDRLELIELTGPFADRPRDATTRGTDDAGTPDGFRILTADELHLSDVSARLNRRPYRRLGHAGWAQAGVDSDQAVPLDLSRLGITNPKGTIQVYLRRFLHVAVDLDFIDGRGTFWTSPPGPGLAPLEYAKRYHHEFEHNAFRSGQLVGIDHPLFGVLIRVTPAPEAEDQTDPDGADAPAG